MSDTRCEMVRERLPDHVGGRLAPADAELVGSHLDACAQCRDEASLLGLLYASRPAAPQGLDGRILARARAGSGSVSRPWWGLAAASVAAVALGIGVTSRTPSPVAEADVPGFVAGAEESSLWLADDGLIAGAPALDGLSEEALETLLEEMGNVATGGAA